MTRAPLPANATVVIIGGGVVGASIAIRPAEAGLGDVVLLECAELGSRLTQRFHGDGVVIT